MPLSVPELLIIGLVLVLLFGAKKLPDTARSLGRSLRIFKSETSKLREDDEPATTATVVQPAPAAPQPIAQAPAGEALEEQARALEEQAARLRAQAGTPKSQ